MSHTITGNMITYHDVTPTMILHYMTTVDQFSVVKVGGGRQALFDISFQLRMEDRQTWRAEIYAMNNKDKNKLVKKGDNKPNGDEPPPHNGGTPGAARVTRFENIVAIAA